MSSGRTTPATRPPVTSSTSQVEQVYLTFFKEGKGKTEAVEDVIDYYDGAIGRSTVWKIVKSGEDDGRLPKRMKRKKTRKS